MNAVFRPAFRPVFEGVFPFRVSRLFANNEQGVWYDPSDMTTLFQDSAGTTPVTAPGQPVGLVLDKSGNGNHATQSTAGSRPTYGIVPETGQRNLLTFTEQFDNNVVWTAAQIAVTANAGASPDGTNTADLLTDGTAPNTHGMLQSAAFVSGQAYSFSLYAKKGSGVTSSDWLQLTFSSGAFGASQYANFNLTTGAVGTNVGGTASIASVGGGWYRLSWTATATSTASAPVAVFMTPSDSLGRAPAYIGSNTSNVFVWGAQVEPGSSATAYQRVGSEFDVTEAGVQSLGYLARTGAGQSLNATMPDLGTNATAAFVTESGVSILSAQTIGAGAYDVLKGNRTFGHVVIDRPLRLSEKTNVRQYLEERTV